MNKKDFECFLELRAKSGIVFLKDGFLTYLKDNEEYSWKPESDIDSNFGIYDAKELYSFFIDNKISSQRTELFFKNEKIVVIKKPTKTDKNGKEEKETFELKCETMPELNKTIDWSIQSGVVIESTLLKNVANNTTSLLDGHPELKDVFVYQTGNVLHFVSSNLSAIVDYKINLKNNDFILEDEFLISREFLLNIIKFMNDENEIQFCVQKRNEVFEIVISNSHLRFKTIINKKELPFVMPKFMKKRQKLTDLEVDVKKMKKTITEEKKKLPSTLQTNFGVLANVENNELIIGTIKYMSLKPLNGLKLSAYDLLRVFEVYKNEIELYEAKHSYRLDVDGKTSFYINKENL